MNQAQLQMHRNRYLETTVQTASPAQLLLMLYDGAIRFCRLGIEGIQQQDYEKANLNIMKVQSIVYEFIASLDRSAEISENLLRLYEYFIHRLTEANVKKDQEPLEEVLAHLIDLKQTWSQAAANMNKPAAGATHG